MLSQHCRRANERLIFRIKHRLFFLNNEVGDILLRYGLIPYWLLRFNVIKKRFRRRHPFPIGSESIASNRTQNLDGMNELSIHQAVIEASCNNGSSRRMTEVYADIIDQDLFVVSYNHARSLLGLPVEYNRSEAETRYRVLREYIKVDSITAEIKTKRLEQAESAFNEFIMPYFLRIEELLREHQIDYVCEMSNAFIYSADSIVFISGPHFQKMARGPMLSHSSCVTTECQFSFPYMRFIDYDDTGESPGFLTINSCFGRLRNDDEIHGLSWEDLTLIARMGGWNGKYETHRINLDHLAEMKMWNGDTEWYENCAPAVIIEAQDSKQIALGLDAFLSKTQGNELTLRDERWSDIAKVPKYRQIQRQVIQKAIQILSAGPTTVPFIE